MKNKKRFREDLTAKKCNDIFSIWEENDVIEVFKYLTGILGKEEQKNWKSIAVLGILSAVTEIVSFVVTVFWIPAVLEDHPSVGKLQVWMILFLFLIQMALELHRCRISNHFLYHGAQKLSVKVYELFAKEDLEHHNQKSVMQALAMVRSDTTKSIGMLLSYMEVGTHLLIVLGYIIILIAISSWFGLLGGMLIIVLTAGIFAWYCVRMEVYGEKSRSYEIKANSQITLGYGIFEEMKIAGDIEPVLRKYYDASMDYARMQGEYSFKNDFIKVIMNLWMKAIMLVIFAAIFLVGPDMAALIPITAYVSVLSRAMSAAHTITGGMNNIRYSKKSYEALEECMLRYTELKEEEKKIQGIRQKNITFGKGIFVRNLTFGYPRKENIFQNASMEIPAGSSVAVIGVSGIGKTTLLSLVIGLLKPQEGEILYDEYDIVSRTDGNGSCKANIGEIVSYIPQTVYMNGETVRNNVALFAAESEIDDARVEECLKCAHVWEEVAGMPEGIHTLISERGTTISGGQRQRIALARALYKDFELLIMDEATAALDMETEKAVIDSIREVRKNKTLLIVTHHMSLANECDIIYRIQDRKLVQVK